MEFSDILVSYKHMSNEKINSDLRVVLLFLDGIGIGKKDPSTNPFFQANIPVLRNLCHGEFPSVPFKNISSKYSDVLAVNATLGVQGLPQSGTGQTALFTGVNGAKKFGRHFGPHPPSILQPIIEEKNIFTQLKALSKSVVFANAYPKRFFDYIESGTRRMTVTTLSCQKAGVPLLTAQELRNDEGISPDFIRAQWKKLGHTEIEMITPVEAGQHLANIAAKHDFTLFEYWLTDHAGHSRSMHEAKEALERFDEFLSGFMKTFNPETMLLIIVSDHGNMEDLSTKSHTRNRVPCILVGKDRHKLSKRIKDLTHITPAIIRLFLDSHKI